VAASDRRSDLAAVPAPLAALLLLGIAPHHFLVVPPCQRRRSLADVCNELVIRDPSRMLKNGSPSQTGSGARGTPERRL